MVFVIGGGPSLKDMDLTPIHSQRVVGVNDALKLGDWVDVCFWGDCRWGIWNQEALSRFNGLSITCSQCHCKHPNTMQVGRAYGYGLSNNPHQICWNRNSGAAAINLAYLLGAKKIVLLGYDMKLDGDKHNWHDNHKTKPKAGVYSRFLQVFPKIASDARNLGVEIYNATPDSMLMDFPKTTIEEVLQ